MEIISCLRDDGADTCEERVTVVEAGEITACVRDDGADACEEGVTVVEAGGD